MARVLSEKHKKAMQAGRQKAIAKRRSQASAKVKAFKDWLCEDAPLFAALNQGKISREEYYTKRPKMPTLPTDEDFRVARGEEAA